MDSDEHVAITRKLRSVAYRLAMAGDHYRLVCYGSEVRLGGLDHPLDISTSRVIDERIDAVPVRIAAMENIRFGNIDGYIAVGMRGSVMFEGKCRAIQGQSLLRGENLARNS